MVGIACMYPNVLYCGVSRLSNFVCVYEELLEEISLSIYQRYHIYNTELNQNIQRLVSEMIKTVFTFSGSTNIRGIYISGINVRNHTRHLFYCIIDVRKLRFIIILSNHSNTVLPVFYFNIAHHFSPRSIRFKIYRWLVKIQRMDKKILYPFFISSRKPGWYCSLLSQNHNFNLKYSSSLITINDKVRVRWA